MTRLAISGFQFHSGSIKSVTGDGFTGARFVCFNSIVVRLKGMKKSGARGAVRPFQFHSGSIKRDRRGLSLDALKTVSIP